MSEKLSNTAKKTASKPPPAKYSEPKVRNTNFKVGFVQSAWPNPKQFEKDKLLYKIHLTEERKVDTLQEVKRQRHAREQLLHEKLEQDFVAIQKEYKLRKDIEAVSHPITSASRAVDSIGLIGRYASPNMQINPKPNRRSVSPSIPATVRIRSSDKSPGRIAVSPEKIREYLEKRRENNTKISLMHNCDNIPLPRPVVFVPAIPEIPTKPRRRSEIEHLIVDDAGNNIKAHVPNPIRTILQQTPKSIIRNNMLSSKSVIVNRYGKPVFDHVKGRSVIQVSHTTPLLNSSNTKSPKLARRRKSAAALIDESIVLNKSSAIDLEDEMYEFKSKHNTPRSGRLPTRLSSTKSRENGSNANNSTTKRSHSYEISIPSAKSTAVKQYDGSHPELYANLMNNFENNHSESGESNTEAKNLSKELTASAPKLPKRKKVKKSKTVTEPSITENPKKFSKNGQIKKNKSTVTEKTRVNLNNKNELYSTSKLQYEYDIDEPILNHSPSVNDLLSPALLGSAKRY